MTIARLLASMALATMLAMPAPAQTIEDAAAAYQRGGLAGALTQFRRLAEQGLAEAQYNHWRSRRAGRPVDGVVENGSSSCSSARCAGSRR